MADPNSPEAMRATCQAAAHQATCDGVIKRGIEYIDDGWHGCAWIEFHETTVDLDQCTLGPSEGRCMYNRGGEDGRHSLIDACEVSSDFMGNIVLWSEGSKTAVGIVNNGLLDHPNVSLCGVLGWDTPVECNCPCQKGYPNAECVDIRQSRQDTIHSGIEECPGVQRHRASAEVCTQVDGASGCETDQDCPTDEACVCRHVGRYGEGQQHSQCVGGSCRTDADCQGDDVCSLSYLGGSDSCELESLHCQAPYDLCGGRRCKSGEHCAYDESAGVFACEDAGACR